MQQTPSWEANRFLASQEIPRILWNPKVLYRTHKCPSPVPILSQIDPVHTPTSHFLNVHLNIILPSTPGSPKWSLISRFPHQNPEYAAPLSHTCYMSHPSHSRFDRLNNIGLGVKIIKLLICGFLHSPVTLPLLGPNILLNTLFPNILRNSQCGIYNSRDDFKNKTTLLSLHWQCCHPTSCKNYTAIILSAWRVSTTCQLFHKIYWPINFIIYCIMVVFFFGWVSLSLNKKWLGYSKDSSRVNYMGQLMTVLYGVSDITRKFINYERHEK